MEKKEFDVQRLKRRLNYLLMLSSKEDDLFECAYRFAINQCLSIVHDVENDRD